VSYLSSRSVRPRLIAGLAVAVLGAVSLAACGSSSGGSSAGGAASGGLTKVTVLRSTGSTFEPLYIAQEQGFFKAQGLDVTITPGAQDTSQNAPSVVRGDAQFAMTDSSGFIKATAQGLPVQLVSDLQASTTDAVFPPSDGLIVKPGGSIKSFADVAGKTIALPALGGTLQYICMYSAEKAGADPSKIKFVSLPLPSLVDSVKKGKVDGAYVFATFLDGAKADGLTAIGDGTNNLPGLPQALLFGSTPWLAKNGATAKKFQTAVAQAIDYANGHPDAVRAVDTKYTQLPAAYIAGRKIQPFSYKVDTSVFSTIVSGMQKYGLITKAPDTSSIFWSGMPKAA
jgi:NitT/TauT family transport system substrate-binding protein